MSLHDKNMRLRVVGDRTFINIQGLVKWNTKSIDTIRIMLSGCDLC